jgi:hypothetical protein
MAAYCVDYRNSGIGLQSDGSILDTSLPPHKLVEQLLLGEVDMHACVLCRLKKFESRATYRLMAQDLTPVAAA